MKSKNPQKSIGSGGIEQHGCSFPYTFTQPKAPCGVFLRYWYFADLLGHRLIKKPNTYTQNLQQMDLRYPIEDAEFQAVIWKLVEIDIISDCFQRNVGGPLSSACIHLPPPCCSGHVRNGVCQQLSCRHCASIVCPNTYITGCSKTLTAGREAPADAAAGSQIGEGICRTEAGNKER